MCFMKTERTKLLPTSLGWLGEISTSNQEFSYPKTDFSSLPILGVVTETIVGKRNPINKRSSFLGINYCIAFEGNFPPRP